jgi:hypothetical protein
MTGKSGEVAVRVRLGNMVPIVIHRVVRAAMDRSRYREEISAVGPLGKIECLVPSPGRFWPAHLGAPPVLRVIVSPRDPRGPRELEVPVDPALLAAGDHNGSTFHQHRGFADVVMGLRAPEVTLRDGWWAVAMGMAAQASARSGQSVSMPPLPAAR